MRGRAGTFAAASDDFTIEDLRVMLSQQMAVPILLPVAVKALLNMPLAEGDYYPGDLLHAVIRLPDDAWQSLADIRRQLVDVIELLATSDDVNEHLQPAIRSFVGTRRER